MNGDVTVRMCSGWAVFLDGRLYAFGDTIELDPKTAAHWCQRGWAETADLTSTVSTSEQP